MDPYAAFFDIQREQAYPSPYATSPLLPLLLLSLVSQKNSPNTKIKFSKEYDYIVVGAGAAGSVVASRLSEKPCVSVLLLEAGKPPPVLNEIPAITRCFVQTDMDWNFFTTPQKHTGAAHNDRKIAWPSGKALGGSTILNAMLYVRGNRRNYDEWAKMGAIGWSYDDVLPYFKKLEDNTDPEYIANGYHAAGGPITASRPAYNPVKKLAAVQAILNEGYKFVDPNAEEQIGFYDYQATIRLGQRCSSAKAYLVPADSRPNLDILPNAMVRKVLIENKQVKGVEFDFNGTTHQVTVRKEVIMSAGTTNTAQLLMLSGIGPFSELSKFNIPVIADLPVGQNMQDHPVTLLTYLVDDNLPRFDNEVRKAQRITEYISDREGPLTVAEGFLLMSYLSNPVNGTENVPDFSVYFDEFLNIQLTQANLKQEFMQQVLEPYANRSTLSCAVQLIRPKSIGTVTLRSTDPYDPPVIDPNYYEDPQDINSMVQGMKVCTKIVNNPAMKRIGAKPIDVLIPGCEEFAADLDNYFDCILKTLIFTTSHQVGTAKMGDPLDSSTVVDPLLRVKGIKGLRVVDASIMPKIPWANTNIPTIMIGEKGSDIIKSTIQCNIVSAD